MNKITPKTIVLILYHLIVGSIIAINFRADRWLMGWDGLYPELNIPLNLIRGFTAGWQEYYGAGLVGGHGFAATLPHTIIIGLFSLIIPQHLVRSVFIFLCYYLGGLGMLVVSQKLLHSLFESQEPGKAHANLSVYISLIASLYYLTNLGTIQTFYVPLEAFAVHFAALPWLTHGLILLLEKTTRKRIVFFCTTLLLSSIQGFIPAVFVAYAVSLLLITGTYTLMQSFDKKALRTISVIWACVISMNAYWLAPVGYFTLTQSKDYINAYNNMTTTPQFIAKSIQYGTLNNAALLKSYLWDSNELGGTILAPWIHHMSIPAITAIGYMSFGLVLLGVILGLKNRNGPLMWGFIISFLYFFGNIAIDTPPFSWAIQTIQSYSPDLAQAFRTTFTKFGIGLSFHYSVFIGIGLYGLVHFISKRTKRAATQVVLSAIFIAALIIFSLPLWQGKLLYQKLLVATPPKYTELIGYLNTLPDGRIADFPQDCAEGWYNELWGYFGSGFLWYGVKHPIMARAFDVWSHTNENYYWEVSTALRALDYPAVERIFDKYGIRYVIYDSNMTHCRSQKGFISSLDFGAYLETSGTFNKRETFSAKKVLPITVYERVTPASGPVFILHDAPNALSPHLYNDSDLVFASTSGYISDPGEPAKLTDPYRPQFSKRGTPLTEEAVKSLAIIPIASVSATSTESAPCQNTLAEKNSLVSRSAQNDTVRLMTTNAKACQTVTFDGINTDNAFVIAVRSRHIAGEPLTVSVTNKGRPAGLDIIIPKHTNMTRDYYFLPSTFPSEVQLTVTVSNISNNQYTGINDLESIELFAAHTAISLNSSDLPQTTIQSVEQVSHPVSWLYVVDPPSGYTTGILTLNQSFDKGWKAFGTDYKELPKHVLVNDWANGWRLTDGSSRIIIIFTPQILEYIGFLLLVVPGIIAWRTKK